MNTVVFQGNAIPYTTVDGVHYIAVKPICEAIGIRHDTALEVIKNNEILGQLYGLRRITGADGKSYEMASLPLSHLNGWLFMIDANRVGEQARAKLLAYQERCFAVLHEHFFGAQQTHNRASEVFVELHQKRARVKELQEVQKLNTVGKEISTLKGDIKRLEIEQAKLQSEMFGKQLDLLTSSPTV